jgi:vibriolysin
MACVGGEGRLWLGRLLRNKRMILTRRLLPACVLLGAAALPACAEISDDVSAETTSPSSTVEQPSNETSALSPVRFEQAVAKAPGELDHHAALRAVDLLAVRAGIPGAEWRPEPSSRDAVGGSHVRVKQYHRGLPVWGGEVIVHGDAAGFGLITGDVARNLGDIATTPVLNDDEALEIAKADYEIGSAPGTELTYARESVELVILPQADAPARLAYHVEMFNEVQEARDAGRPQYFIDALDGSILQSYDGLAFLSQASGPGGNARVTRQWINQLDVEASGSEFKMDTIRQTTYDLRHTTGSTGTIVTGPLANIGDAAINDAHGFVELSLDALQNWFGHNSVDDAGMKIRSRVHYGTSYANAFWDGAQLTFGDGDSTFHAMSGALDALAHELNHGFTEHHSGLVFSGQAGALNESFSDVAATIAEFYAEGDSADWTIGEDFFKSGGAVLRYMCDPTRDGSSIDNAADYSAQIGVNYASGVGNKAFCLAARRLASGSPDGVATAQSVRRAGEAWYEANAHYWTSTASYMQGCGGILGAATGLGFSPDEIAALRDSWIDVGVTCEPTQRLPPPPVTETFTGSLNKNQVATYPKVALVPGTTVVATTTGTGTHNDVDLYVRFGQAPSLSAYDCRSWNTGSTERCSLTVPAGQTQVYVSVRGYAAVPSAYTLKITYTRQP